MLAVAEAPEATGVPWLGRGTERDRVGGLNRGGGKIGLAGLRPDEKKVCSASPSSLFSIGPVCGIYIYYTDYTT